MSKTASSDTSHEETPGQREVVEVDISKELTANDQIIQRNRILLVMQGVMKEDVHYGTIPFTNKPTLLKPGAERLLMTFGLSAGKEDEWPMLDLSGIDERRYRFMIPLYHRVSGAYIGFGVGECSTNEEKYRFRGAVCAEEYAETDPGQRREKWFKGKSGATPYKKQQIRTHPADLANTVLKIAKKRALIDAVLTTTGASEVFSNDFEDLSLEVAEAVADKPAAAKKGSKAPPKTGPKSNDPTLHAPNYGEEAGHLITDLSDKWLQRYGSDMADSLDIGEPLDILDQDTAELKKEKEKHNAKIERQKRFKGANEKRFAAINAEWEKRQPSAEVSSRLSAADDLQQPA